MKNKTGLYMAVSGLIVFALAAMAYGVSCRDSDHGINYYVKGVTNLSNGTYMTDACWGSNITLLEHYCLNSTIERTWYNCTLGCYDGACIHNDWCNEADIDEDGVVGTTDFIILSNNWGASNCSAPTWCNGADIDENTVVGGTDFIILSNNWGRDDCIGL